MGSGPIGYASSTVDTTPTGLRVQNLLVLDIAALGKVQRTKLSTDIQLTRDLHLKSIEGFLDAPGAPFRVSGTASGDTLTLSIDAGGARPDTVRIPLRRSEILQQLLPLELAYGHQLAPGRVFSVPMFDPMAMQQRDVTVRVLAESTLVVPDSAKWDTAGARWVPAREDTLQAWKIAEDFGGTESWIDRQGRIVSTVTSMGFKLERTAFELAVENWRRAGGAAHGSAGSTGGGGDIIDATAITADVPLTPENLSVLRVRIGNARLDGFDLNGGREQLSGDTLTVRRETGVAAAAGGPAAIPLDRLTVDSALAPFLASEPLIQANDPRIQAEARRIVGRERRSGAVAELLTHWVYQNLKKEITISVPSAVQVLDQRRGDCNEHTVLYVALARSLGLPARTAAGLVYLRGRFYYHAWPEVWLGQWVAVDPTFDQFPADASHLRFVIGGLARQVELLRLIGRVTVSVVGSQN